MEQYSQLADHMIRNDRLRVVVFAGPEEREMVAQMRTLFPPATIFFDRLTIPQLISALARLTLLVSNDTGPAHLASAVGVPLLLVMDRLTPHSFMPLGDQHRAIYGPDITKTTVDEVYRTVHEMLAISRTNQLFYSEQRQ